jgi:hypothetical protein
VASAREARDRTLTVLHAFGIPGHAEGSISIRYPDDLPYDYGPLVHHLLELTEARFRF